MNELAKYCLGLLFLSSCNLFAQSKASEGWVFGIQAGTNLSKYSNAEQSKAKVGMMVGVFTHHHFNAKWSIEPQLNYELTSTTFTGVVFVPNDVDISVQEVHTGVEHAQMGLLSLPIYLKYQIIPKVSIGIGPQISAVLHSDFHPRNTEAKEKLPSKFYSVVQFGGNASLDYTLDKRFDLSFYFHRGFTDISTMTPYVLPYTYSVALKYKL